MRPKRGGRGRRDPKLEARWRRMTAAWERSGQTARGFCRRRRINEHTFYGWRRTLRERDAERSSPAAAAFAPVDVLPAPGAETPIEVVVGDAVVRVAAGVDAATLRAVLAAVRAAGC